LDHFWRSPNLLDRGTIEAHSGQAALLRRTFARRTCARKAVRLDEARVARPQTVETMPGRQRSAIPSTPVEYQAANHDER